MTVKIISMFYVFLMMLFVGCANNNEPVFDEWVDGLYQPRTVTNYKIHGKRDGATTQVFINFEVENIKNIELELEVTYNPSPILSSGHWKIVENKLVSGDVRPIALKFLGGQGEGPSLGGSFELEYKSHPRFRVVIPLRPINKPTW